MANFEDHITQAKSNLKFLKKINNTCHEFMDWQVTTAFYVGVHLVNAHLFKGRGATFNSHKETFNALNPNGQISLTKLGEKEYLAYRKLYNLSRRSRYLCLESGNDSAMATQAHLTHSVHFKKSIKNLDVLLIFVAKKYSITFDRSDLNLLDIRGHQDLDYFRHSTQKVEK